jgi:hypothetical protein
MTWPQFVAARRLLAEERYGAPRRALERAENDAEDASVEATKAAIRKVQGR